ncbi:winged helix-turn-helix domain-containing protein [Streptomyces smyrnaeus]|uniref:Winged helix-turn-helix domain-containing protein n=1 Tax=Streptomyces smyrnaeus TaxID=1387713 RepID=A0ABS3XPS4_9ACTN|nr:BTAD domain-containing putative transcriptional regulator [Streptomyces smyrnaeus]MBO8197320.1 winged helix-turn-helix domain-containing protein [Streptomyces smyrnaeus]
MHRFHVRVLGPLELDRDGEPVALPRGRQRTLLATLALRPGSPVPTGVIADRLWDERPPASAQVTIRNHVKRLRRLLDPAGRTPVVPFEGGGYRLAVAEAHVDLYRFRDLTGRAAATADPEQEARLLRQALALWRGPALGDIDSASLHREVVPTLAEEYAQALHRRIRLDMRRGAHAEVITELRRLVSEDPLRERFWAQLMRALHHTGRRAEALVCYEQCRRAVADALGVEPSAELRELHRQLLTGDAAVLRPGSSAVGQDRRVPRQLPPDIAHFTGRSHHLAALDKACAPAAGRSPAGLVALVGEAGVGKTALAVRWAHRVRESFPDGQLHVDLRGYAPDAPLSPSTALATLLSDVHEGPLPEGADARGALLRSVLSGKRVLVLLDNARDAEQVRPLLPGGDHTVVVTSRNQLRGLVAKEGAHRLPVDRLTAEDAAALLGELIGHHRCRAEPEATARLLGRGARLPLLLRNIAERVNRYPRALLAEVADALYDTLYDGDGPAGVLCAPGAGADPSALVSWTYRTLPPEARRLHRLLGTRPERVVGPRAAAAVSGTSVRETGRLLDSLAEVNLLLQWTPYEFELDALSTSRARADDAARPPHPGVSKAVSVGAMSKRRISAAPARNSAISVGSSDAVT